jgi:hypothetical protein
MVFNSNFNSIGDKLTKADKQQSLEVLNQNYRFSAPKLQYVTPQYSNDTTYYNRDELNQINGLNTHIMEGQGIGKFFKKAGKQINKSFHKVEKVANVIADSAVNKNGVVRQLISSSADVLIPYGTSALGAIGSTYLTGNPLPGAMAGKITGTVARKQLKHQTGYGAVPVPGVGTYDVKTVTKHNKQLDLDKLLNKYVPDHKIDVKHDGVSSVQLRNMLVKRVMKERKLSLPQASKYVKENNLY